MSRSAAFIFAEEVSAGRLFGITVEEAIRRHRGMARLEASLSDGAILSSESVRADADASENVAWLLFLAVPCADMTDVGKKAVRLLEITSGRGAEGMTAEELNLFACSLLGMGVSSDEGRGGSEQAA